MGNRLLSVVVPSRNDQYLYKTVRDLLDKAEGQIEIIIVQDGLLPKPELPQDSRVSLLQHGGKGWNHGMRASINFGVSKSRGEYIMKVDEHCVFDQGYDVMLATDCQDNWLVTPRRYRNMDENKWQIIKGRRSPVDNMHFAYPYLDYAEWRQWNYERSEILIDDCLGMEGSCYFMTRKHWDWLGGLDDKKYGKFHYEPQELCLKTWLGGGRVVTNKKTSYAHWFRRGKGYGFNSQQYDELYSSKKIVSDELRDYWLNDSWQERVHSFEWLMEKFWPVPGWPTDWQKRLETDKLRKDELGRAYEAVS